MTEDIWKAAENGNVVRLEELILGVDLNRLQNEYSPLYYAAREGHVDCVRLLLERGANVDLLSKTYWTPLNGAARNRHLDCVKVLLEGGANTELGDDTRWTPLTYLAGNGDVDGTKLLLSGGANVNGAGEGYWTPLFYAAINGHENCVKLLLEGGANVNLANGSKETPLYCAAANGHADCVKLLLEGGADGTIANEKGESPVAVAVSKQHLDCILELSSCGQDALLIVARDIRGKSLLHVAAERGHLACLKILLEGGAIVNLVDKSGCSPLYDAAAEGHVDCVKSLLERSANVDLADNDDCTPLNRAAAEGHVHCVKVLLEKGANVDLASKFGTPFSLAQSNKKLYCAVELLAFGAKVNYRASLFGSNPFATRDNEGRTALHIAVERSRPKRDILSIIQAYPGAVDIRDNSGKTPLDIAIQCGSDVSVLWLLFQYQNEVSNNIKEACPLLCAATRMTRRTIQSVHVHLIGHGYAGKTTCRLALNKTLKHLNPIMFGLFGNHKDVSVDRSSGSGKTEGMEMDAIETPHHKWLIRDYGGQEDFHVNHARFLSVPGSIYVIVVALWDEEKQCRFSVEEIKNRYLYWLKFLNSIAEEGTTMNCITVINFGENVGKQYTAECVSAIEKCCTDWRTTKSSVTLHGDPSVLSVCKVNEVRNINKSLKSVADTTNEENSIPVLRYIDAIETSSDNLSNLKSRMDRKSTFIKSVCLPAICALLNITSALPTIEHLDFVCDKMIEYLCASGKIIVVPTSTSNDPLIVLDVNWLSKELLGALINRLSNSGSNKFVLTADQIDDFTNKGSKYFDDVDGLALFLESIGACIVVNDSAGTSGAVTKRWFPMCGQRKFVRGDECVPMDFPVGVWSKFRKVVRMFQLSDPDHQMFPPGYFIDLFLGIVSLFPLGDVKTVKVFINGLEILYLLPDSQLQVVLTLLDDNCSFTVEVSFAVKLSDSPVKCVCWEWFTRITDTIQKQKQGVEHDDIVKVSPWFDNVKLTEIFVDPTDDANVRAFQDAKNRKDDKALLATKELRQMTTLRDMKASGQNLKNLYIYGCDGNKFPVDENTPRHIMEALFEKVDVMDTKIDEGLKNDGELRILLMSRLNTTTVTLSSDLVQESFKAMLESLKSSMEKDTRNMIESCRSSLQRDGVTMAELQESLNKLKDELFSSTSKDSTLVLGELQRVDRSLSELTSEVKSIQQLDSKTIQEAIVNAIEGSKTLRRIDNMMHAVVKGTSDVPTIAIVIPVVKKGSLLASFNPSNWTSNEYSLYFVCNHSHQVVVCGPDGKGYRFRRAKEWFKKVAPVLKVCLIAAKIALTISGIPIPISGVVQSLDQITAVAETTKYLNTALSVVDAASGAASTLGVAVGDQGSGVDDKSVDNAEQYVKSLEGLLKQSNTIEAYKQLKALLDEVDPTLGGVGVEKVTSESGKTGWVKKGDQAVKDSFMRDEKWPMKIDELKENYCEAVTASSGAGTSGEGQSRLGERSGLWIPKFLFGAGKKK